MVSLRCKESLRGKKLGGPEAEYEVVQAEWVKARHGKEVGNESERCEVKQQDLVQSGCEDDILEEPWPRECWPCK